MKFDALLAHCGDLGIEVEWEDLGARRRGEYRDDDQLIVLNCRLTRVQAIATLAHEIGHATFGDRCTNPRNERRAWEYGAALTIEVEEYAAAEHLVGCHVGALAHALDVTPKLVDAWRRWFERRYPVEVQRLVELDLALE